MIYHPRPAQRVELHYRASLRQAELGWPAPPRHLARGVIIVAGRGPGPINALVALDDDGAETPVVVPRGNMEEVP